MSELFIIRKAKQEEWEALADLHYRAYANRFFDEKARDRQGRLYGAPLAREFPVLAAGQNGRYFRSYWEKFSDGFAAPDPRQRNYCFVAEKETGVVAFVKGSGAPVSGQMKNLFNEAALGDAEKCCELGSIYCDPGNRYCGAGRRLVETFACAMLGLGYESMVTEAYNKNDSPLFFKKLGAKLMGACRIPNDYLTSEGKLETVNIPGRWLYWDKKMMRNIIGPF